MKAILNRTAEWFGEGRSLDDRQVRLALRRPYTSAIAALLIVLMGAMSVTRMIADIFPTIDIPVVVVVWNYPGLSTEDMEQRVVFISERAYSTTVNGIQRIESQSIPGTGIIKVYFQPGSDIGGAIAQISTVDSSILKIAPSGMTPPAVIQFNASNVPVVQMTLSSKTRTEREISDYSLHFIRVRLFTIPGLSTPGPFGGKSRLMNVSLDQNRMIAKGFSPIDVVNALQASNVIVPADTGRIGDREYNVKLNSSPDLPERFNRLPIDQINSVDDFLATPVGHPDLSVTPSTQPAAPVMRLGDIASIRPTTSLEPVNHYTVQRVIDIAANVDGRDLGIVWMLAITGTTINVESLMGAIMSVGISVSNSILVVSFANDPQSREEIGPVRAMLEAGRIRLRPILMTALTMIIGMVPMALGMGQAGEQNAPLGRAVIGRS